MRQNSAPGAYPSSASSYLFNSIQWQYVQGRRPVGGCRGSGQLGPQHQPVRARVADKAAVGGAAQWHKGPVAGPPAWPICVMPLRRIPQWTRPHLRGLDDHLAGQPTGGVEHLIGPARWVGTKRYRSGLPGSRALQRGLPGSSTSSLQMRVDGVAGGHVFHKHQHVFATEQRAAVHRARRICTWFP